MLLCNFVKNNETFIAIAIITNQMFSVLHENIFFSNLAK